MADTKTARPSLRVFVQSSAVVPVLNDFGLFATEYRSSNGGRVSGIGATSGILKQTSRFRGNLILRLATACLLLVLGAASVLNL